MIVGVYGKVLRLPAATVMLSYLVGGKLLGISGTV
jgi:predicted PurR-regulated permease PerM